MRGLIYQILRPFSFAQIRHASFRPGFIAVPLIGATAVAVIFVLLPARPVLTGEHGLGRVVLGIVSILPGFYIAALAAVATFARSDLDKTMPAPAPTLSLSVGGNAAPAELTLRMFLSLMFAYLSALSFLVIGVILVVEIIAPSVGMFLDGISARPTRTLIGRSLDTVYVGVVAWLVARLLFTTFLGLYFLGERIHRPNS